MDWNWFFSSLAQCGAALIGIIAAFIISKLLNESEKADSYQNQLKKLKAQYTEIGKRIDLLDIGIYNRDTILSSFALRDFIQNKKYFDDKTTEQKEQELYARMPFLYKHQQNRDTLEKFIRICKTEHGMQGQKEKDVFYLKNKVYTDMQPFYNQLSEKNNEIQIQKIESESLIRSFQILNEEIQDKQDGFNQTKFVLRMLMFGLFFTVIYPLSFLPMAQNETVKLFFIPNNVLSHIWSNQGWLLLLLFAFVEGIFCYFFRLVNKLKKKYKTMKAEIGDQYLNLWGYSEYFEQKSE